MVSSSQQVANTLHADYGSEYERVFVRFAMAYHRIETSSAHQQKQADWGSHDLSVVLPYPDCAF